MKVPINKFMSFPRSYTRERPYSHLTYSLCVFSFRGVIGLGWSVLKAVFALNQEFLF